MAKNGKDYDYDLSAIVAGRIGAEPLRCWRNAAISVFLLSDLLACGSYVEGWIVLPRQKRIAIIEHGWATLPDRGIIDPTIILTEKQNQPVSYFPGYALSRDQVCGLLSGSILPLIRHSSYGDDGMKHRGYQVAYQQAWQRARELAKKRHLPQTAIKVSGRDSRRGITLVME
jgi:hypothetical protein